MPTSHWIDGRLAVRFSAYSAYHGGFIDNLETTRNWYNGTVSNNAQWAGNDYNSEHEEGGRIALRAVLSEGWSATLSYDYQRLTALGAWDQDPNYGPRKVSRFGPESLGNQAKIGQLHLDGDVGIADLVFASTYWSLPTRRSDEYSQYMENFAPSYTPFFPLNGPAGPPPAGTQQGFTCLSDPAYGGTPFTGCQVPLQYYEYHTNPERWSNELRFNSKPGGRWHWVAGAYWEKTRDKTPAAPITCPTSSSTAPPGTTRTPTTPHRWDPPRYRPAFGMRIRRGPTICRRQSSRTSTSISRRSSTSKRA